MSSKEGSTLLPERHPEKDFFIADIFDNLPVKDDMASMEHPIFTLSTKKDVRDIEYINKNVTVSIKPTSVGLPTIFDKDVLLYCGSLLMEQLNKGLTPPKTLRISSHDLLVATNRRTSGEGYTLLKKALDRLQGVSIKTNIKTNKREITSAFGLIDSWEIIESSRVKDRMIRLEITLSDWFYNSILGKEVLTINKDYFRLRKATERRLYELARRHCGKQKQCSLKLETLKRKAGSTGSLRMFRYYINQIANDDYLPDYKVTLDDKDIITFTNRNFVALPLFDILDLPAISLQTRNNAQKIIEYAGTGWEFGAIQKEFSEYLTTKEPPKNINGAFIGFVKKKVREAA